MGAGSYQPLAKSKGVRCESESEGSRRQTPEPRNTNCIRHIHMEEIAKQIEVRKLPGMWSVNAVVTWEEGGYVYHGRSVRGEKAKAESRITITDRSQQRP